MIGFFSSLRRLSRPEHDVTVSRHTIEGILLEHLPDDLSSSILQLHLMRMAKMVGTTTPTRCQWAYMRLPQQSLHRRHPNSPFRPSKDMSGTRRQYSGLNILGLDKARHSMTRLQGCRDLQSMNWPSQIFRLQICTGI